MKTRVYVLARETIVRVYATSEEDARRTLAEQGYDADEFELRDVRDA